LFFGDGLWSAFFAAKWVIFACLFRFGPLGDNHFLLVPAFSLGDGN